MPCWIARATVGGGGLPVVPCSLHLARSLRLLTDAADLALSRRIVQRLLRVRGRRGQSISANSDKQEELDFLDRWGKFGRKVVRDFSTRPMLLEFRHEWFYNNDTGGRCPQQGSSSFSWCMGREHPHGRRSPVLFAQSPARVRAVPLFGSEKHSMAFVAVRPHDRQLWSIDRKSKGAYSR